MTARAEVSFHSGDGSCAAYLYRPVSGGDRVPCVVMAHGFTGTRDDALPGYAEAFAAAGAAALVFDYRHFGASPGEPRQLLSIRRQHEDYRAAIAFARGLEGVDPERLVLWGSSFSGGHVVAVAAGDSRLAGVIAQCPFADGIATIALVPPGNLVQVTLAGISDQLGALLGRPPRYLPAVGPPGTLAAMTASEADPGFRGIVPSESRWDNRFTARLMLSIASYRPITKVRRVTAPLLVCVGEADKTTPPGAAIRMAGRAPHGELRRYQTGHFEIYSRDDVKRDQVDFLRRHVVGAAVPA